MEDKYERIKAGIYRPKTELTEVTVGELIQMYLEHERISNGIGRTKRFVLNSPIWKHKSVIDEQTAIIYLNSQIDKIINIINWLSSEKVDWLEVHMLQSEAKRIASREYLMMCQRKNISDLQNTFYGYKRSFRTKLKKLNKDKFDIVHVSNGDLYMVTKVSR
ncbi:hypothetical protein ACRN9C_09940 [Shewanella frigidimarina]|uniref:hypothetical protein n=1 Tax=Shewanella frigidimarina TaxID=56812 RepID=UPI003D78BB49